jgi:aspartyl-tRNA(Asn)/glutamyl-tRNA(Gln) amidotransferase subunit A
MHPDVVASWQLSAKKFSELGATVEPVKLPDWFFDMARAAGVISTSEMFSLHRPYIEDMSKPIGPGVRARALAAKGFAPGAYAEELRRMHQRRAEYLEWARPYDAVLLPAVALPAIPLSEVDEASPLPGYLTRPGNYLGLCALSMPSGFSSGLPLGIQIVGKPYAEATVLKLGKAFQDATDFHKKAPDLKAIGL